MRPLISRLFQSQHPCFHAKPTVPMSLSTSFVTSFNGIALHKNSSSKICLPSRFRQRPQPDCYNRSASIWWCTSASPPSPSSSPIISEKDDDYELYDILGLPRDPDPRQLTQSQLRDAYLKQAKLMHPDVSKDKLTQFDKLSEAWDILSDVSLRRIYNTTGMAGLNAVMSIENRSEQVKNQFSDLPGDQLDMLSETGQLMSALLSPSQTPQTNDDDLANEENELKEKDACPRSIDEAIQNLQHHKDESVKYYILWWIYRFKVKHQDIEKELIKTLNNSNAPIRLRRRSALALGTVCNFNTLASISCLEFAFHTSNDYFLKYRSTEALTNIAYAFIQQNKSDFQFPSSLIFKLYSSLKLGIDNLNKRNESSNLGYQSQESLFNIENIEDESVRLKLYKIFEDRKLKEYESKRTTMTPQLGVNQIGQNYNDLPYEWIIKAFSSIIMFNYSDAPSDIQIEHEDNIITFKDIISCLEGFDNHEIPLVKYASRKALFELTKEEQYAIDIMKALEYGIEHHYSQRVLIRDLGDVGYWKSAKSITECPMVENSFKILSLKNMLSKLHYDTKKQEVKSILSHMDSLL